MGSAILVPFTSTNVRRSLKKDQIHRTRQRETHPQQLQHLVVHDVIHAAEAERHQDRLRRGSVHWSAFGLWLLTAVFHSLVSLARFSSADHLPRRKPTRFAGIRLSISGSWSSLAATVLSVSLARWLVSSMGR